MSLAFAKDSKRFSQAVEGLRREGVALTDENIEKRYNALGTPVVEAPVVEEKVEEEPKKSKKK